MSDRALRCFTAFVSLGWRDQQGKQLVDGKPSAPVPRIGRTRMVHTFHGKTCLTLAAPAGADRLYRSCTSVNVTCAEECDLNVGSVDRL